MASKSASRAGRKTAPEGAPEWGFVGARVRELFSSHGPLWLPVGCALAVAVLCGLGFFSLAASAGSGVPTASDLEVARSFAQFRDPMLHRLFWALALVGDPIVAWAGTISCVALLVVWGRRYAAVWTAVVVGGGHAAGTCAKALVARPRPDALDALVAMPRSGSMPSGHALFALLVAGLVAFALVRSNLSAATKMLGVGFALTFVTLMGIARIYLGVHWATDVLSSWALGAAWLSVCLASWLVWTRNRMGADGVALEGTKTLQLVLASAACVITAGSVVFAAHLNPLVG